jgi:hypothetical protein
VGTKSAVTQCCKNVFHLGERMKKPWNNMFFNLLSLFFFDRSNQSVKRTSKLTDRQSNKHPKEETNKQTNSHKQTTPNN